VEVLDPALGTGDGLAVVGEEVEPLVRVDDELSAGGALESLGAAGDRGEDIIAVHGAKDELRAVPDLSAVVVPALQPAGPALQAGHAHRGQEAGATLRLHLDTGRAVLPGGDEECPVNQRISFKDDHLVVAEDAGDLVHLVSGIAGENEAPRLVITNTTLILHLDVIGVDLLSWKNIECTVVISPKEDTASAVVP